MPLIDPNGVNVIEDRAIVVYDPLLQKHIPAGYVLDPATNKYVPSGKVVQLATSLIPVSTEAGNGISYSKVDGKLYVAPTAVINVADDQALVASETDTTQVAVTSTPETTLVGGVQETTVNHSFTVDVKVAATPASGVKNSLEVFADGLYAAREVIGESAPPTTVGDGTSSSLFYGGLDSTLGTPMGWLEVARKEDNGDTTLYSLPYFLKRTVAAGTSIFVQTEGGGGNLPPPPPPPDNGELPPAPPLQSEGFNFATMAAAVQSNPSNYSAGFVTAVAFVVATASSTGTGLPPNAYEAGQAIWGAWNNFQDSDLPFYFSGMVAMGITEAAPANSVFQGIPLVSTVQGGTVGVHTIFNSADQYAVIDTGVSVVEAARTGAFTWTTDINAATRMSNDDYVTFVASYSWAVYRARVGGGHNTNFHGTALSACVFA